MMTPVSSLLEYNHRSFVDMLCEHLDLSAKVVVEPSDMFILT